MSAEHIISERSENVLDEALEVILPRMSDKLLLAHYAEYRENPRYFSEYWISKVVDEIMRRPSIL
jgi:hypothetical protein